MCGLRRLAGLNRGAPACLVASNSGPPQSTIISQKASKFRNFESQLANGRVLWLDYGQARRKGHERTYVKLAALLHNRDDITYIV
jgi:hypothetical protein